MMKGYVVKRGEGVSSGHPEVKASAGHTGGVFTLIESDTNGGAPPHVHSREDEAMYVLQGEISVRCGDDEFEASRGAFVFLPRDVPHSWDVLGARAVVLILTIPGGFEEFLREFHEASDDLRATVAAKYGIQMLPPADA